MTVRDTAVRVVCLCQVELAKLLLAVPPGRRGAVLQQAASFTPGSDPDQMLAVGSIRAAFADFWEARFRERVPVAGLRCLLEPPVPIATALEFNKLILPGETKCPIDLQLPSKNCDLKNSEFKRKSTSFTNEPSRARLN